LEEENHKLREENEHMKNQSKQLVGQVQSLTEQCSKQHNNGCFEEGVGAELAML
jgi:hypothetical protein